MILAICPNDKNHKTFGVTAHVAQDWEVDENGSFIRCTDDCSQITHKPDADDLWTCSTCGAIAIVKNI